MIKSWEIKNEIKLLKNDFLSLFVYLFVCFAPSEGAKKKHEGKLI